MFTLSLWVIKYLASLYRVLTMSKAAAKGQWHKNPESISHHIHRVGHHFPNKVVEQACDWYGYRHRNRRYIQDNASSPLGSSIAKRLDYQVRRMGLVGDDVTSVQRTKQVEATVRELFPRIPDADLDAIVSRAFEEVEINWRSQFLRSLTHEREPTVLVTQTTYLFLERYS